MRTLVHWIAAPALVAGLPATAWGVQYLTVEQAKAAIFPGARLDQLDVQLTPEQRKAIEKASGVRVRQTKLQVWKVETGGWLFVDEVIGKHEFITYAVGLKSDGSVKQIEVMDYRENYGSQVRDQDWRAQFVGKTARSEFKLGKDIRNISGATLSCRGIASGVKRLLATYEAAFQR